MDAASKRSLTNFFLVCLSRLLIRLNLFFLSLFIHNKAKNKLIKQQQVTKAVAA
jgi:hypothetical protein